MKIAIIVWDLSLSGGTQRQALELAYQLTKQKQDVTVFAYAYNPEVCYPDLSKKLRIVSLTKEPPRYSRPKNPGRLKGLWYDSYRQFHHFDQEVKQVAELIPGGFDVLNPHDLYTERVAYYYKQRHNTPAVWMSNDVPLIFQILDHNRVFPPQPKSLPSKLFRWVQERFYAHEARRERKFLPAIDVSVVLDSRNQRQFKRFMNIKARIVRSGLDAKKFRAKFPKKNRVFTLLGTGIFFRLRRFEDLIKALGLLKKDGVSAQLNIIGSDKFDPAYGAELYALVDELGLKKEVNFLGRVSEKELTSQYRNADVFVFPNHRQTWGLAVFEALASGTPVIVSRTAGAHEVLTDGQTGLLVDPLSPDQIASQVKRLKESPELQERLSRQGREFVEKEISWETYTKNMLSLFKKVAK